MTGGTKDQFQSIRIENRRPGVDEIRVAGMFDVPLDTLLSAGEIRVRLLGADGSEVHSELIGVDPADVSGQVYTHLGPWTGGARLLRFDTRQQQFILVARADLSRVLKSKR